MIERFRRWFMPQPRPTRRMPPGERAYAIGDIHGRLDLFGALLDAIERDDAARGHADTTIILLGDLVDRGPDSAGVISAARDAQARRRVRIIAGNHEQMFLESFERVDALRQFLQFGGAATIASYVEGPVAITDMAVEDVQALMRRVVPEADRAFLRGFEDRIAIGDYVFVHAGIRPGTALADQQPGDLRWIREPFLGDAGDRGFVVVHGHTIAAEPHVSDNRIGIDTGAFRSGRLTALGLEGARRWFVEASAEHGAVTSRSRPA